MKRKLGIVATVCTAFALCFVLVGCGGGVDKSLYTGAWVLESGNNEKLDADSIALMKTLGLSVVLNLNEDGTGSLDMFGKSQEVTWEAESNTDGTATVGGSEAALSLADEKLTLKEGESSYLTFARSDGTVSTSVAASSSAAAASSDAATADADESVSVVGADGDAASENGDAASTQDGEATVETGADEGGEAEQA